ncbi:hypothetical protein B0H11DRAFT_2224531 [Mycena galericulata]|nr:hypothetical protein B0H11DRAFT_2224531 [Mycena galericulata]
MEDGHYAHGCEEWKRGKKGLMSAARLVDPLPQHANDFVVKIPGPQILEYMIQVADSDQTTRMEATLPANFFIPDDEYDKVLQGGGNGDMIAR